MDAIADFLTGLFEMVPGWLNAALLVVGAASAVTALTPSVADDRFLARVRRVLELLALNVGHARPGTPPKN